MIQPDAAADFLCNAQLRDQGLLSRILLAAPPSIAGTRLYQSPQPNDQAAINAYGARLLSILEAEPAFEPGKRNELTPRALPMSAGAEAQWRIFYDHIESQCGAEDQLAPIRDFAAKAAEHVARIAGVLTIIEDLHAEEISAEEMRSAILLGDWYVNEACRMHLAGRIDPRLIRAAALLRWLQGQPMVEIAFRDILREGPNTTRKKKEADEAITILAEHGWISETSTRPRTFKVKKGAAQ
jgi:hypothetical protein